MKRVTMSNDVLILRCVDDGTALEISPAGGDALFLMPDTHAVQLGPQDIKRLHSYLGDLVPRRTRREGKMAPDTRRAWLLAYFVRSDDPTLWVSSTDQALVTAYAEFSGEPLERVLSGRLVCGQLSKDLTFLSEWTNDLVRRVRRNKGIVASGEPKWCYEYRLRTTR